MRLIDADLLKHDIDMMCDCFDGVKMLVDEAPTVDAVEVVRCKDCIYWKTRHVRLDDGTERDYLPGEDYVDISVGINVGSQCRVDCGEGFGYTFREDGDFCSRGRRKMDAEVEG